MYRIAFVHFVLVALVASSRVAAGRAPYYKAMNADLASGVVEVARRSLNCGPYLDGNALCKLLLATPPFNHNVRFQSTFSAYFAIAIRTSSSTTPVCKIWAETRLRVHAILARILKRHSYPGVVLPPLTRGTLELGIEYCEEFDLPPFDPATWAALRMISKFYSAAPQ